MLNFLRQAMAVRKGISDLSILEVRMSLMDWMKRLGMDDRFTQRYLNEGFSGGERKRNEILQMAMMEPEFAVLDETDSGLDIDALRAVGDGVNIVRAARPEMGHPAHHPLPADPRSTSRPMSSTSCSTAGSCNPGVSNSRPSSSATDSTASGTQLAEVSG